MWQSQQYLVAARACDSCAPCRAGPEHGGAGGALPVERDSLPHGLAGRHARARAGVSNRGDNPGGRLCGRPPLCGQGAAASLVLFEVIHTSLTVLHTKGGNVVQAPTTADNYKPEIFLGPAASLVLRAAYPSQLCRYAQEDKSIDQTPIAADSHKPARFCAHYP